MVAVGSGHRLELSDQLVARGLVARRIDDALRLAALHVEEEASVVAAVSPRDRVRPVDRRFLDRDHVRRPRLDRQVALADEPVVEADPAHHRSRAVVAHHDRDRVVGKDLQKRPDLLIEEPVVVLERRLVLVPRLVERMGGVPVLPEHVVEAVRRDLAEHEEVPGLLLRELASNLEAPLRHLEDLVERHVVAGAPEVGDVEDVVALAELGHDLRLELRGGGPAFGAGRREEASDPPARELLRRRERRRHADQQRAEALAREDVPDGVRLDRVGRRDRQAVVGGVLAIAEPVDPEMARRRPGHRAGPRRDGDRRRDAREIAPHPPLHQRMDVGRLGGEVAEQQLRRSAVQADDRDPRRVGHERVSFGPSSSVGVRRPSEALREIGRPVPGAPARHPTNGPLAPSDLR